MDMSFPYKVAIRFPGDLEYIPSVRKFISELLIISNYNQKFAYRSEIIIDEICNNAVNYGCRNEYSFVDLACEIFEDKILLTVKDQGGSVEDISKLKIAIKNKMVDPEKPNQILGLEIVKMLAEDLNLGTDSDNSTIINVTKKREI
jgi:serine/threonine-protein kinase RsbW